MKQCTKCLEIKALDQFFARKRSTDGKTSMCKECYTVARRDYYKRNTQKVLETNRKSRANHIEERNLVVAAWQAGNREKVLLYKRRHNEKRRSTVEGKLRDCIAAGIRRAMHGKKTFKTFGLLPYTSDQMRKWLTTTMPKGYTWDDFMEGRLHIDHVIPVSAFNITDGGCIDFQRCWALENLRLLPAQDNLRKWAKLDEPFQPSLGMAV